VKRPRVHGRDCYKQENGRLVYTPCRPDGRDRNLRYLKEADFQEGMGRQGLTLVCSIPGEHRHHPLTH